jgi:NlpC/P60 family
MSRAKTVFSGGLARGLALVACLACGCMLARSFAMAQETSTSQEPAPNFRLASIEEGRKIADAAREQDLETSGAQDCSHLVHQAYVSAGFEYAYASSFELYAGNANFARVKNPHAGDLIVWPGHAGIVLDPREHSFYSLVSTGLEAQDYEGTYWKSRGRPRFYRYKMEGTEILTASKTAATPKSSSFVKHQDSDSVIEKRTSVADSSANRPPKMVSERTKMANAPTATRVPPVEDGVAEVPQSIVIASGKRQPTASQVAEGISELTNASASVLRADDSAKLAMPVVIFEQLHVERLDIKKDHGWARLQIDTRATIASGDANLKRRHEKVRWELRRTESGWEAVTPTDRAYVRNDVAVRNLAAQLAELTARNEAATNQEMTLRQESRIANLLSALLTNK